MKKETVKLETNALKVSKLNDEAKLKKMVASIRQTLIENKAENTEVYDVRPGLNYTDIIIVTTGAVPQHVKALYTYVREAMLLDGIKTIQPSKKISENYWQVLDFGDIIVHILLKENRLFYKLDELYAKLCING